MNYNEITCLAVFYKGRNVIWFTIHKYFTEWSIDPNELVSDVISPFSRLRWARCIRLWMMCPCGIVDLSSTYLLRHGLSAWFNAKNNHLIWIRDIDKHSPAFNFVKYFEFLIRRTTTLISMIKCCNFTEVRIISFTEDIHVMLKRLEAHSLSCQTSGGCGVERTFVGTTTLRQRPM